MSRRQKYQWVVDVQQMLIQFSRQMAAPNIKDFGLKAVDDTLAQNVYEVTAYWTFTIGTLKFLSFCRGS